MSPPDLIRARNATLDVVPTCVVHEKAVGVTASSRALRLRCSVEMHRTPSSGIMHGVAVRQGKADQEGGDEDVDGREQGRGA
jgi:hypothetical protein